MPRSTLIAPCAGSSSRYGPGKPKYLYTLPNGKPLFYESLAPLLKNYNDIAFGVLKEHDENYHASTIIKQTFSKFSNISPQIKIIDHTLRGPASTVKAIIESLSINGQITIKDCDSLFSLRSDIELSGNKVCFADAKENNIEGLCSKSSLEVDSQNRVHRIIEKMLFSPLIAVGGYSFQNSFEFLDAFNTISNETNGEIFVSHVIENMIESGVPFWAQKVTGFKDLGTKRDFVSFAKSYSSIFCDIDGVIFKNRGMFGPKTWADKSEPLSSNINRLLSLQDNGATFIFSTSRSEEYRVKTFNDLVEIGFQNFQLVMNLPHSPRLIINDFSHSNPYPSCSSISILRDSDLTHYVDGS